jgi:hypothetical protein
LQRPLTFSPTDVFFLEEARRAPEVAAIAMEQNTAAFIRARGKEVLRGRDEPGRRQTHKTASSKSASLQFHLN